MEVAFCGGGQASLRAPLLDLTGRVAMEVKSGRWQAGMPNVQEIARRRIKFPSLNNLKDQYFIIFSRSKKVKNWFPINIISGSEASKSLKSATDNDIAKGVGLNKLADFQIVKAIGMNIYKQADEVKKNAIQMHPRLAYADDLEYGFKEIANNTRFNENPGPYMALKEIRMVPAEAELRNILDEAGDAASNIGDNVGKVGDNIKGFFGSLSGGGEKSR